MASVSKEKLLWRIVLFVTLTLLLSPMPGRALVAPAPAGPPPPAGRQPEQALPGLAVPVREPDQSVDVELLGQIGGVTYDIARQGPYAYVGVGSRLVIVDISDPARPIAVGQTRVLSYIIASVAVEGDYVYVSAKDVYVFYVGDPAHPVEVGFHALPGLASDLKIAGGYLYAAAGDLHILRLSNPASPVEVGSFEASSIWDLEVAGNYAYVADGITGMVVLDVSDPAHPYQVAVYPTPNWAAQVTVEGDRAYVAATEDGLRILDISDPVHPVEIGIYDDYWVDEVAVEGPYAYVLTPGDRLRTLNLTNPGAPFEIGYYYDLPYQATRLEVEDGYIYATAGDFAILDVSSPGLPALVGAYDPPGPAEDVALKDHVAFVADSYEGLRIIDVANPVAWHEISTYDLPGLVQGVALAGDTLYVAAEALHILNVAELAAPAPVGVLDTAYAYRVTLDGDRAYVGDSDGMRIVDVSNPGQPVELGLYPTSSYINDIVIEGNLAYLALSAEGLHIVDVSNPSSPQMIGVQPALHMIYGVDVVGTRAYVADHDRGLRILDVGDPAHPVEIGFYDQSWYATGVLVEQNYAFVAAGFYGLYVLDVSDPAAPVQVGAYDTPWYFDDMLRVGHYLYAAEYSGGLLLLRAALPTVVSIPVGGGTLVSTSDRTTYTFPAGTFSGTVEVSHTPRFEENLPAFGDLTGIGHLFEVTAVYESNGQPAQPQPGQSYSLRIDYSDAERGPAIEQTLALYYWSNGGWVKEPTSSVDVAGNRVTATPDHFSQWAVLGETHRLYLPLAAR